MERPLSTGPIPLALILLALVMLTLTASAANPKRVLILSPFRAAVSPFTATVSEFRSTLVRELGEPVDIHEVTLDTAHPVGAAGEDSLLVFLETQLLSHPMDLIVTIGGAVLQFADRHRGRLFGNTPVLAVGSEPRLVPASFLSTNATVVTQSANIPGMVEDILRIQPDTTHIAVVFGISPLEQYWASEFRRELQVFADRITFTFLDNLPLDEMLKRCAALPPRSFILYVFFLLDANGIPYEKSEPLRRLHQVANAPLFGYFQSELGLGPIGGRLYMDSELGRQGAHTAVRILRGEKPESIPPQVLEAAVPVYDWRELQRWHISESSLPAGSVIEYRQPGLWEQYHWPIGGVILLILLQTVSIIGLLTSRASLRREEAAAELIANISSRFVKLSADEVDEVILGAEADICRLLDLDLSALWQWSGGFPGFFTLTHYYDAKEGPQPSMQLHHEDFPWIRGQMLAKRIVAISSLDQLPAEAARDRQSALQLGIRSSLCVPLSVGGETPVGILALNTTRKERNWPAPLVKRIELIAQIFASTLARKGAEQSLRESDERFRLLIERAPDAILVQDFSQDQFILANEAAEKLFGCSREELLASGPQRFYTPKQPDGKPIETSMRAYSQAALRGEEVVFEQTICNALGQLLSCEVRLTELPAGKRELVRASFINITERKQAEATLRNFGGLLIEAHERERARLARELHDDVTQRLARLAIDAGVAQSRSDGASAVETMDAMREGLVRLSQDVHALSYRLHPSLLEDLGLGEAFNVECERFSRQASVTTDLDLQDLPAFVPRPQALCLFRVGQEALQNVAKHARAQRIQASIRAVDGGLELVVMDDGGGFDPAAPRNRPSIGLTGMRERLLMLGGKLDIESAPGSGTTIRAWVPMEKSQS